MNSLNDTGNISQTFPVSPDFWNRYSINLDLVGFTYIIGFLIIVCGLATIASHGFILLILLKNKKLWVANSALVVNLVLPILLLPPIVHFFTAIPVFLFYWTFSYELCQVVGFLNTFFHFHVWVSLSLLSLDRLLMISIPFKYDRFKWPIIILMLVMSWGIILLICILPFYKIGGYGFDPHLMTCILTDCSEWGFSYSYGVCKFMAFMIHLADYFGVVPLLVSLRLTCIVQKKVKRDMDLLDVKSRFNKTASTDGENCVASLASPNVDSSEEMQAKLTSVSSPSEENENGNARICKPPLVESSWNSSNDVYKGLSSAEAASVKAMKNEQKVSQTLTGLLLALISTFVPGTFIRMVALFVGTWDTLLSVMVYQLFYFIAIALFPVFVMANVEYRKTAKAFLGIKKNKM